MATYKIKYILTCINDEIEVYFYNAEYYNSKQDKKLYRQAKKYKTIMEDLLKWI
jgi:hypothetical protein